MKYIRTYETEEKFLTDKDSTSREFRLKPTLYKYSEAGDHIHLELDDPRKHGDSTYMEITLDSDVEFSFYIGNAPDDTQTTMNCSIDWGDGTVETKTITKDDKGFKLAHSYVAGSYKIELYDVEREYGIPGDTTNYISYISPLHSSVRRIVLGSNVIDIGESAFNECKSLISVYIPESVTNIGGLAFVGCISLTSINIPESITSIGDLAFSGFTGLTSVYIPGSVNSIGYAAFFLCTSLTSINISEGVTSIGQYAFQGCESLTSINIPEGVTSIGGYAFCACSILTSVYIPGSVNSIGEVAFYNCPSLTTINIPEGIVNIGERTFAVCYSLTSIYIPESVTTIGDDAFHDCTSLTSINIPGGVNSIGEAAFFGCTSLTSISSFNPTTPTLGSRVFNNIPKNGTLHVKPGATGYDAWLSKLPSGWTIVEDL